MPEAPTSVADGTLPGLGCAIVSPVTGHRPKRTWGIPPLQALAAAEYGSAQSGPADGGITMAAIASRRGGIGFASRSRQIAVALATGVLVVACGSSGGSGATPPAPGTSDAFALPSFALPSGFAGGGGNASEPQGPPTGKVRLANFYAPNGQPGPALDIYDLPRPGPSDKPLIANLAYGQVSAYVSPRAGGNGSTYNNLYIYPAGSKTPGQPIDGLQSGGNISQSGWEAGQQGTYVLGTNAQGPNGSPNVSFQEVDEVMPGNATVSLPSAPPGGAVMAVNEFGVPQGDTFPLVEVRIDGVCPADEQNPTSGPVVLSQINGTSFGVSSGSHTVDAVVDPAPGTGLSADQCKAAAAAASASVSATAGSPALVLFYGPSMSSLKIVVVPVG
jgi:hypothetical protein